MSKNSAYFEDKVNRILHDIDELFEIDIEQPQREQQRIIADLFGKIATKAEKYGNENYAESTQEGYLITNIEHLIAFIKKANRDGVDVNSIVNMEELPEELRNLTESQYLEKLGDIIFTRREHKDWGALFKVVSERCANIEKFILNMENRKYSVRNMNDAENNVESEQPPTTTPRPKFTGTGVSGLNGSPRRYTNQQ